jgi:hypothetical protein
VPTGLRVLAPVSLLAALAASLLAAAPAVAGATPDSAARAALQRRIGRLGSVQLVGPAGSILLFKPVVREDGLHMREPWKPPRAALIVLGDVPAPPRPVEFVPWSAIEQVQVRRSGVGTGLLAGAAFGAGLAAILAVVYHHQITGDWETAQPVVLAGGTVLVGAGAVAGMLLGSLGGGWDTAYPAPAPRGRP